MSKQLRSIDLSPVRGADDGRRVTIRYREAGSGRPVVLVHGNFASGRWFAELLQAPPPGLRLIAPDLPNFGASDAMPEPIEITTYADYLLAFMDALELERVALVGHSLGGAVAQAAAVAHPERVTAMLLISSAAPDGHATPEEHYPVLASLAGNREAMHQALAATMPTRQPPYFAEIVDDALAMQADAVTGNARALERFDISSRTASVSCPVLVLHGGLDLPHLITPEIARRTAASYPHAELVTWPEVGHSPQIEAPQRFAELLERFLQRTAEGDAMT